MTKQQAIWASKHDWCYYAGTDSMSGKRFVMVKDDMVYGGKLLFTDFNELYAWAGY